jgi:hypothetical protein
MKLGNAQVGYTYVRTMGLKRRMYYSVTGTCEVNNTKLIKLRNPTGKDRYRGPYGWNNKNSWTAEAQKACNYKVGVKDGNIVMPLSIYKKMFAK